MIRKFKDVIPEELSRMSLVREVNFGIELEQGTALISNPLYKMAPKLKELKEQFKGG